MKANLILLFLSLSAVLSYLAFEPNLENDLRVFALTEDSRVEIIQSLLTIFYQNPEQLLFGADVYLLEKMKAEKLIFDSSYTVILAYSGLFGLIIFTIINAITIKNLYHLYKSKNFYFMHLLIAWLSMLAIGIGGNILLIFPHSILFWVVISMISTYKQKIFSFSRSKLS